MQDGDTHLETVHLVGNMPVSVLSPYRLPGQSHPPGLACGVGCFSQLLSCEASAFYMFCVTSSCPSMQVMQHVWQRRCLT